MSPKTPRVEDLNILYLEDEPLIALDTSEQLEDCGFDNVATVYSLNAARNAVDEEEFQVALLDINLNGPETSIGFGTELAEKGKLVIFASGHISERDALSSQGFAFVEKPFDIQQIVDAIKCGAQDKWGERFAASERQSA